MWVETEITLDRENHQHCITSGFGLLGPDIFAFRIYLFLIIIFIFYFSYFYIKISYLFYFLLLSSFNLNLYVISYFSLSSILNFLFIVYKLGLYQSTYKYIIGVTHF